MMNEKVIIPNELLEAQASQWEEFDNCKACIEVVLEGNRNGLLLAGQPGIGKSRIVMGCINDLGLIKGHDWIRRKGQASPMGFYRLLHAHRGKILVLDDYDAILKNENGVNMLKAVLDDESVREVSYDSSALDRTGLPRSFEFMGKIIFISNLRLDKIDSAIYSRCIKWNLELSGDEILARMYELLPLMSPNVEIGPKIEVVEFLNDNREELYKTDRFNLRVFNNALAFKIMGRENWKEIALVGS